MITFAKIINNRYAIKEKLNEYLKYLDQRNYKKCEEPLNEFLHLIDKKDSNYSFL